MPKVRAIRGRRMWVIAIRSRLVRKPLLLKSERVAGTTKTRTKTRTRRLSNFRRH